MCQCECRHDDGLDRFRVPWWRGMTPEQRAAREQFSDANIALICAEDHLRRWGEINTIAAMPEQLESARTEYAEAVASYEAARASFAATIGQLQESPC